MFTLNDFKSRPQTQMLNFGDVSVPTLMNAYKEYHHTICTEGVELVHPETCAMDFYLVNTATAMLRQKLDSNQPLPSAEEKVFDTYYELMGRIGLRAFYYLLLICTRESRHGMSTPKQLKVMEQLGTLDFWNTIHETNEIVSVKTLSENPPNIPIRDYVDHLLGCFELGTWSSSFGGPKWANVARPLRAFVHGEITMEMLVDVVWTLAHNGGPIFNKGMLFHVYGSDLHTILDVQASGQIPNLIANGHKNAPSLNQMFTPNQKGFIKHVREIIPDFGVAPINWDEVKKNAKAKKAAIAEENVNVSFENIAIAVEKNWAKKKTKPVVPKAPMPANMYQVTPIQYVKKLTRKELNDQKLHHV